MTEAYAIIRHRKHRTLGQARVAAGHNRRTLPDDSRRENIDHSRSHLNRLLVGSGSPYDDLVQKLEGVQRKTDSVVSVEILLTASPNWFDEEGNTEVLERKALEYLKEKYGDRCYYAELHLDEKTPHIHAHVIPEELAPDRRRKDESELVRKLNAKKIFSPKTLVQANTDWAKLMEEFGLIRGVEGKDAEAKTLQRHRTELAKEVDLHLMDESEAKAKASARVKAFKSKLVEYGLMDALNPKEFEEKIRKAVDQQWRKMTFSIHKENEILADEVKALRQELGKERGLLSALTQMAETSWPLIEKLYAGIVGKFPDEPFPTIDDMGKAKAALAAPEVREKIGRAEKKRAEKIEAAAEAATAAHAATGFSRDGVGGVGSGVVEKAQKTLKRKRRRRERNPDPNLKAKTAPKAPEMAQDAKPATTPLQTPPEGRQQPQNPLQRPFKPKGS